MTEPATDLSPSCLAISAKANLHALFQSIATSASAPIHSNAHGFSWRTGVANHWFNGALSTMQPDGREHGNIEAIVCDFRRHGIRDFSWWLAPHLDPDTWRRQLQAHGFQYDTQTPGMAIDLDTLPTFKASELTIRRIEAMQELAGWTQTLVQGFGMQPGAGPPFLKMLEHLSIDLPLRHYLGMLDGVPVSTATLFLGAGVAGIYNVATVSDVRGRGFGSQMTLAPLYEARAMGYRVGILQSSKLGYPVYERLGFVKVCNVDYFYWQEPGP